MSLDYLGCPHTLYFLLELKRCLSHTNDPFRQVLIDELVLRYFLQLCDPINTTLLAFVRGLHRVHHRISVLCGEPRRHEALAIQLAVLLPGHRGQPFFALGDLRILVLLLQ